MSTTFPALICHPPTFTPSGHPHPIFIYTPTTTLARDPTSHELTIRIIAAGVCHTDILVASFPPPFTTYPMIMGHEGAGIVEEVGADVTVAKRGDLVLLSYDSCQGCGCCKKGGGAWCERFAEFNTLGREGLFSNSDGEKGGVRGKFFGQSSFSSRTVVSEQCVVNVGKLGVTEEEAKLLAPLGCGIMTGAGNMVNIFDVGREDAVLITGVGGVGLGAVMAAKVRGAKAIVVVDRVKERLELAKELGATHVVDTTGLEMEKLAEKIREVYPERIAYGLDCAGNTGLVGQGMKAIGHRGHFASVGVPPFTEEYKFGVMDMMQQGKKYSCNFYGDAEAKDMVPQMIQWWREGKLPLEKFVKFFPAKEMDKALQGMHDGSVVKAVLLW